MPATTYRNRRAARVENSQVSVTVLAGGGHIAEIRHKPSGVNPLWTPPWPSIEPSEYDPERHPEYGSGPEAKLLAGIMGHNLCLDIFGGVSEAEAAAGLTVHGEASVVTYELQAGESTLTCRALLPEARLAVERTITLTSDPVLVRIRERVENLAAADRPVGWTQHVTMGPPFIEPGVTQFRANATRSKVYETDFTGGKGYMRTGAEFDWPHVPRQGGGTVDLRVYPGFAVSGGYTSHRMDPASEQAWFLAWSPRSQVLFGYLWKRSDFPWLGIWEENHCRDFAPWNGVTLTRGMEFGVSPMPETRRAMVERGSLFGVPGYRWLPARTTTEVEYLAFITTATEIPNEIPAHFSLR